MQYWDQSQVPCSVQSLGGKPLNVILYEYSAVNGVRVAFVSFIVHENWPTKDFL